MNTRGISMPFQRAFRQAVFCVAVGMGVSGAKSAVVGEYVEGDVIVTWKEGVVKSGVVQKAMKHRARVHKHLGKIGKDPHEVGVLKGEGRTTEELIAELQGDPDVLMVEPNYIRHVSSFHSNDTEFSQLWGMKNTGGVYNTVQGVSGVDARFVEAWSMSRPSGSEVVVAVMDTGVDRWHPDLVGNLWINSGEVSGNTKDDDGNGYVDDLHGYNFVDGNADVLDSGDHGTHVSGTIGAIGNNGLGVVGVDFRAKLMELKVSRDGSTIDSAAVIEALQYVTMMKNKGVNIVAINASFGGGSSSTTELNAIKAAGDAGVVMCVAAGNETTNNDTVASYPANYRLSNMIVVAALTPANGLASFSNYGAKKVDLAAPGESIYSTMPWWMVATTASVTAGLQTYSGLGMMYGGVTSGVSGVLVDCKYGINATDFPSSVRGNIALIKRGTVTFSQKVSNAMQAGAKGVIMYNNVTGALSATMDAPGEYIPVVTVSLADGTALLAKVSTSVTIVNSLTAPIYRMMDGTSMATPMVTGAVAFAAEQFPTETAVQRVARVVNHTTPVAALTGKVVTGGRLDLLKMVDTDGNGLPDWWEIDYFGGIGSNPNGDADGDGMTQLQEWQAGTNPKNAASRLVISRVEPVKVGAISKFDVRFPSVAGVMYQVQASDSMAANSWVAVGNPITGTGSEIVFEDTIVAGKQKRFYRVSVVP